MNPVRRRKLCFILFAVMMLSIITALITYALRQNISLFYTPTQVVKGEVDGSQWIRVGGLVVQGSLHRGQGVDVEFQLTDYGQVITVKYKGILPDLFREGQGIVAKGRLTNNHELQASEVLAKHDANYMPPEVKDALARGKK